MNKLFEFFRRFHFVIIFFIIEVVCFVLIIKNNPVPSSRFTAVSNQFRGWSQSINNNIISYFNLQRINEQLVQENQLLHERLNALSQIYDTSILAPIYKTGYDYIPAKVVGNTTYLSKNTILLNKGRVDGIRKNMGVIAPSGIVGLIIAVSEHYSIVLSLLNKASLISAKILPYNYVGTIFWKGSNARYAAMKDLPTHIYINIGDTIVTSGFSSIFPEDVIIGTVEEYHIELDKSNYIVDVLLSTDFANLQWVYIVKNLASEEQNDLLQQFERIEQNSR